MNPLTQAELEGALVHICCQCLNLSPGSGSVRTSWPSAAQGGGQPGWRRDEDVLFIRAAPSRDPYSRFLETEYQSVGGSLMAVTRYTRSHEAQFIFYGPNATDRAEILRRALLLESAKEVLRVNYGLYPLPHIDEPLRADELEQGGWWGRADLTARFYEGVTWRSAAEAIASADDIHIMEG